MGIAENYKIVPVMNAADVGIALAGDSIDMSGYHRATFICTFGAVAGAGGTVDIYSGATNASLDSALTFSYAYGGAAIGTAVAGSAASSDVLAAWSSGTTAAIGDTAHDNYMLVCVVDASAMDIASGEKWLTIYPNAGTSGVCHIVAILEPRYSNASSETALA